jgi:hypothetical protein
VRFSTRMGRVTILKEMGHEELRRNTCYPPTLHAIILPPITTLIPFRVHSYLYQHPKKERQHHGSVDSILFY